MATVLVVAAEARELAGLLRRCRRRRSLRWPVQFAKAGELNGDRWLMAADGAGPTLAGKAADAARDERVDMVVSTGFCGALDPALRACQIFVATEVESPEQGASYPACLPDSSRPFARGRLLSVDYVVRSVEEKRRFWQLGAAAVEMEAAAVAERAARRGVPFFCVRAVTDTADENLHLDFNAARGEEGRLRTTKILAACLRNPRALAPELYGLYRRSRAAGRALGDFLADCRY